VKDHFYEALAIAAGLVTGAFVSEKDARVQQEQDAKYCQQVERGAWPDYEKQYSELCKQKDAPAR
jgi:hypothetical protein